MKSVDHVGHRRGGELGAARRPRLATWPERCRTACGRRRAPSTRAGPRWRISLHRNAVRLPSTACTMSSSEISGGGPGQRGSHRAGPGTRLDDPRRRHRLERLGEVGRRHVVVLGQPGRRQRLVRRAARPAPCSSGSTTRRASLIRTSRIVRNPRYRLVHKSEAGYGPRPCRLLPRCKAQLTGPGGMFEVVTEEVLGRPMQVYPSRMPSLRSVAEVGAMRGDDQTFLVYGDRTYGFTSSSTPPTAWPTPCAIASGCSKGDRIAVLSPEQPGVVPHVLGHRPAGRHPRRAQRVVDHRRDRVRPAGLRRQGAGRRPEALRAHRRLARHRSRPRARVPRRLHARRRRAGRRQAGPQLRRAHRAPPPPTSSDADIAEDDPAVIFYTSGTTGRPKGAISTHRSMIANLQNTMYGAVAGGDGRRRARSPSRRRARTSPCSPRRCSTCRAATPPWWSDCSPG